MAIVPKISQALQVSADELLGIVPLRNREAGKDRESGLHTDPVLTQSQVDSIFNYAPASVGGRGKKILVVDDADFLRMTLEDILNRRGHNVLQARNGLECLDILQKETVDVCLLDIVMPVMDGVETLRRIREEKPELRVIMLSAMARESIVRQALQSGADAFAAWTSYIINAWTFVFSVRKTRNFLTMYSLRRRGEGKTILKESAVCYINGSKLLEW